MRSLPEALSDHRPPPLAVAVGVVAAVALTLVLARVFLHSVEKQTATPSPPVPTFSTTARAVTPTGLTAPSSAAAPTMGGTAFTTPGVLSGWNGFSASQPVAGISVSLVLPWHGGYVAVDSTDPVGPAAALWTSPDGQKWTPVASIDASAVFVSAAPGGLVAIAVDPAGPYVPGSVWTSSDGAVWRNAGASNLPGMLVSVAGTDGGIVATVDIGVGSDGATETYMVEFSIDGIHWAADAVLASQTVIQPGTYMTPHVQAGNGRFFLMGAVGPSTSGRTSGGIALAATASPHDAILWSNDGRTWTRAGGSYGELASSIDFGRDGLLLSTYSIAIPGGSGMALSTDGGKTWIPDDSFGPLGVATCTGQCSTGPAGQIGSNGTVFVAVRNGGDQAWLSYDGHAWSPVAWTGGDPSTLGNGASGGFAVLPRGVLLGDAYSAAK